MQFKVGVGLQQEQHIGTPRPGVPDVPSTEKPRRCNRCFQSRSSRSEGNDHGLKRMCTIMSVNYGVICYIATGLCIEKTGLKFKTTACTRRILQETLTPTEPRSSQWSRVHRTRDICPYSEAFPQDERVHWSLKRNVACSYDYKPEKSSVTEVREVGNEGVKLLP